jgi:hypothetical protein
MSYICTSANLTRLMILVVSTLSNYIHGHAPVVGDSAALDTVAMVSSSNVNTSPVTGRDFRAVDTTVTKLSTRVATQETGYTKVGVEVRVEVRVHSVHGYLSLVSHGFGIGIRLTLPEVLESTITVVATDWFDTSTARPTLKFPSGPCRYR